MQTCNGLSLGIILQRRLEHGEFCELRCFCINSHTFCISTNLTLTKYAWLFDELGTVQGTHSFNNVKFLWFEKHQSEVMKRAYNLAKSVFMRLRKKFSKFKYCRIDLFYTKTDDLYLNEVEPLLSGREHLVIGCKSVGLNLPIKQLRPIIDYVVFKSILSNYGSKDITMLITRLGCLGYNYTEMDNYIDDMFEGLKIEALDVWSILNSRLANSNDSFSQMLHDFATSDRYETYCKIPWM